MGEIVLGAALAIVSGVVTAIVVARLQERRIEQLTLRLRRSERREEREDAALLELERKLPTREEIDAVGRAVKTWSSAEIVKPWARVSDQIAGLSAAWEEELKQVIATAPIREAVEEATKTRRWMERSSYPIVRIGADPYGNPQPEAVDDVQRFAKVWAGLAKVLDRLHELIAARLRG